MKTHLFFFSATGNCLVKYSANSAEQQKKKFMKEKEKIATIVKVIRKQENKIEPSNFLVRSIGKLVYQLMLPKFATLDRHFQGNENCTHCHTCAKICPVQNIKMIHDRPKWQGNCEHCMACIQWCPAEAIQYGTKTMNRQRYHHPEVQVKDLYPES